MNQQLVSESVSKTVSILVSTLTKPIKGGTATHAVKTRRIVHQAWPLTQSEVVRAGEDERLETIHTNYTSDGQDHNDTGDTMTQTSKAV